MRHRQAILSLIVVTTCLLWALSGVNRSSLAHANPTRECVDIPVSIPWGVTCMGTPPCNGGGCWQLRWVQEQCVGVREAPCRERSVPIRREFFRAPCVQAGPVCVCGNNFVGTGIFEPDPVEVPNC